MKFWNWFYMSKIIDREMLTVNYLIEEFLVIPKLTKFSYLFRKMINKICGKFDLIIEVYFRRCYFSDDSGKLFLGERIVNYKSLARKWSLLCLHQINFISYRAIFEIERRVLIFILWRVELQNWVHGIYFSYHVLYLLVLVNWFFFARFEIFSDIIIRNYGIIMIWIILLTLSFWFLGRNWNFFLNLQTLRINQIFILRL